MRDLEKRINTISIWIAGMICTFLGFYIMVFVDSGSYNLSTGMTMGEYLSFQTPYIVLGIFVCGGIPWMIYSALVQLAYKNKGVTFAVVIFAACLIFQLILQSTTLRA